MSLPFARLFIVMLWICIQASWSCAQQNTPAFQYRWPPINSDSYHGTIMAVMAAATAPEWLSELKDEQVREQVIKTRQNATRLVSNGN